MIRPLAIALVVVLTQTASAQQKAQTPPDLSGYWGPGRGAPADPQRVKALPPNTIVLRDAGAVEFPSN